MAVWQGTTVLRNPSNPELARAMGLKVDLPPERTYDLVVVGAGPAGFGAAVYGASEGLSTLALESVALGGQAGTSSRIENYLGFPVGLSGFELATRALAQADKFGAETAVPEEAVGLSREGALYRIALAGGGSVLARSVIAASGARYQRLDVEGLERFEGLTVHYAATEAEAQRFEGGEVVVVGGGNSAGQAAVFLASRMRKVHLLIRGGDLAKGMSTYLVNRVAAAANIELLPHTEVRELLGEDHLAGGRRRGQPLGRAADPRCHGAVRLHRSAGELGLAAGMCRARPPRFRHDRSVGARRRARGRAVAAPRPGAVPVGDQPARGVRRGRRPQWLDQALCVCRGRGGHGGLAGPPAPLRGAHLRWAPRSRRAQGGAWPPGSPVRVAFTTWGGGPHWAGDGIWLGEARARPVGRVARRHPVIAAQGSLRQPRPAGGAVSPGDCGSSSLG